MRTPEQDLAQYESDMEERDHRDAALEATMAEIEEERGPVFDFAELHELAERGIESWRQRAEEDYAEARFEARQQDW